MKAQEVKRVGLESPMPAETLGAYLRRLRLLHGRRGLSLSGAASRINISKSHLWDIEQDNTMPGFDKMVMIARLYGVSLDVIAQTVVDDLAVGAATVHCASQTVRTANGITPLRVVST